MSSRFKSDLYYNGNVLRFEGAIQPMEGILSARRETQTDPKVEGIAQYTFNCESKYKDKLPYSVTIYKDGGKIYYHQYQYDTCC